MSAYVLREGKGKIVALYTRCEDELLCRAELLTLLEKVSVDYEGQPVWGYYDVDPSFTISEFKRSYRDHPSDYRKLMANRAKVIRQGWPFRVETEVPDEGLAEKPWARQSDPLGNDLPI